MRCYKQFKASKQTLIDFYLNNRNKRNNLAMFRLLYPNETKGFKFPRRIWKPKILPSNQQIRIFYDALPEKYKPIFILLYESGLRIGELLDCDIDRNNRM